MDVGCSDGATAAMVWNASDKVESIYGIDPYLPVNKTLMIPASTYDGVTIPFDDKTFDVALSGFILHHSENPSAIIGEMRRVARRVVIAEDYADAPIPLYMALTLHETMRIFLGMDYQKDGFRKQSEWEEIFAQNNLKVIAKREYSSLVVFFPFLRHILYVLADKDDADTEPIELFDPKYDLVDALNLTISTMLVLFIQTLAYELYSK